MAVCQFYASPTPEQAAQFKITDPEIVLGCKNEQALHFFVPVPGGAAVRVGVCQEHGDYLERTVGATT
jgi:hypothetical protein